MAIKEFKTETKRLLDLMINSIYTNKEIFLRELISNAIDAIDKRHYLSLTDEKYASSEEYHILLSYNKDARTITIKDNGIGMTYDEVINNLGTIAKSGSKEFIEKLEKAENKESIDIIGQFGVGFYSAFMVADEVVVKTKSNASEKGYVFTSKGMDTYDLEESDYNQSGTEITLFLREDTEDYQYSKFLDDYELKRLVKKYSDYVRYPIQMNIVHEEPVYDEEGKMTDEVTKEVVLETLNSMKPIWKKNKNEVSTEELNDFYKQKFNDYQDPLTTIFTNVEGLLEYSALIYIPQKAPYNLYSDKYEKGLQLYTKGVFVLDKCKELVPDYLRFIKGLVDSADFDLNISREILQQSSQLTKIAKNIEKKIISELQKMLKNDRDKYLEFFDAFGINLKYGLYDNFGEKKDLLKDLILFTTINGDNLKTLDDYVKEMKEDQKYIYFASGKNKQAVLALPQMDKVKSKGYDVLVLTDDVDEFMIQILHEYEGKEFKSINQGELDLVSDDEKKEIEEIKESKKDLLSKMKEALKDEVSDVVLSSRLTESPVCLVSGDGLSFEMEKVLNQIPNQKGVKASRILEINPKHELFKAIETIYEKDPLLVDDYAQLLLSQALLIEGIPLEDPVKFSNMMCKLMINNAK